MRLVDQQEMLGLDDRRCHPKSSLNDGVSDKQK